MGPGLPVFNLRRFNLLEAVESLRRLLGSQDQCSGRCCHGGDLQAAKHAFAHATAQRGTCGRTQNACWQQLQRHLHGDGRNVQIKARQIPLFIKKNGAFPVNFYKKKTGGLGKSLFC